MTQQDLENAQRNAADVLDGVIKDHPDDCNEVIFALLQLILRRVLHANEEKAEAVFAWVAATNEGLRRTAKRYGSRAWQLTQSPGIDDSPTAY
jgi:hypothetical protein